MQDLFSLMQSYDLLVEKIARAAGLTKEEIERKIEAKKARLSGLISKEGAAQIISAELGVNFDNEVLKICELMPGAKKVNVIGKIVGLFPIREYNKNGKSGKVSNFILGDETGTIKVVLWDTNHISLIENGEIAQDSVIEIRNGNMRENELHLTGFSEFKKSPMVIENVKKERAVSEKTIVEIQEGQSVRFRATVVQFFPPRFFSVCPECGKKGSQEADGYVCGEHGKVQPKEKALVNLVLDDGTESIRAVLFSDQIAKIANEDDLKTPEGLQAFRDNILGVEFFISGSARRNSFSNNTELSVSDIEVVNVDKLIENLEKV